MKFGKFVYLLVVMLILVACSSTASTSQPVSVTESSPEPATPKPQASPTNTTVAPATAIQESTPTDTASAPPATEPQNNPQGVSFAQQVLPIFAERCAACHGGRGGLYLDSYEGVMVGGKDGIVIVPGDPEQSLLIKLVSSGSMPKGGAKLAPEQIQLIIDWILAGAPNN